MLAKEEGKIVTKTAITRRTALAFTLAAAAACRATATWSGSVTAWPGADGPPVDPGVKPARQRALALNLSGLDDWNSGRPFLNIAKFGRGLIAGGFGAGNRDHEQLRRDGALDDDGYPTRIPPDIPSPYIEMIWDWGGYLPVRPHIAGRYIFRYDGEGDFSVPMGGSVVSNEPGRIVFDADGSFLAIRLSALTAGNHPRNWRICREEHVARLDAGEVFHPDYLARIRKAGLIRAMDWGRMNLDDGWSGPGPEATHPWFGKWDQRPLPTDITYTLRGVPLEVQVRLANDAGANLWVNIPHIADEDYERRAAALVRDSLDPSLEARAEKSNEMWNASFRAFHWLVWRSQEEWGKEDYWGYSAYAQTLLARRWQEEWARVSGPGPRLVTVLAVQAVNDWGTSYMLNSAKGGTPAAKDVVDEVAIATYFGGAEMGDARLRADLVAQINRDPMAARRWLRDRLLTKGYPGSIPDMEGFLQAQKRAIKTANPNLRMVAYEGASHVHHSFSVAVPDEDLTILTPWMAGFSYSAEMGELYRAWADQWERWGEGPHMDFGDFRTPDQWGSWGSARFLEDRNPRLDAVLEIAERPVWWA